jgi:hypothetical protein
MSFRDLELAWLELLQATRKLLMEGNTPVPNVKEDPLKRW